MTQRLVTVWTYVVILYVILYLHRHLSCGNYMYCIYVYLPFFIYPENGDIPKMRVDKFELHLLRTY